MANKPLGSISVNQAPQYGDKTVLEQSAKATKSGAVSGAVVLAPRAGRPAGRATAQGAQGGVPPQGAAAQQAAIPQEHVELIQKLPYVERAAIDLAARAQGPGAGPYTQFYAGVAQRYYEYVANRVHDETPFFDEE